jgi:hypothetical protein
LASGLDKMGTRDVRCEHAGAWSAGPLTLRDFRESGHSGMNCAPRSTFAACAVLNLDRGA